MSEEEKYESALGAPRFEGERAKIADILGKKLVVLDFAELPSKFREGQNFALINAEIDGKKIVVATGSQTLLDQLRQARQTKKLPLKARIVKPAGKRYYMFAK
jgi:hypothetical protein